MSKSRTFALICVLHLALAPFSLAQAPQDAQDAADRHDESVTFGTSESSSNLFGDQPNPSGNGVRSESRATSGGAYGRAGAIYDAAGGYSPYGEGGMRRGEGGEMGGGFGWVGGEGQSGAISYRMSFADRPLVIVTQPIQPQAQLSLKEDLNVMDKLIGEQITRVDGEPSRAQAMGIRISMPGANVPIYIENCGALFSYRSNMPLAPSGKGGAGDDGQAATTPSWERVKRELAGRAPNEQNVPWAAGQPMRRKLKFEPAKYDELVAGILKVLPEATNIRHLGMDEFVIVTVSGFNDAGTPLLLTLKAKKSDIDAAAEGKLTPEAFKARVAMRAG